MANVSLPAGLSIVGAPKKARVPRRPKHPFIISQRPYELTPFFIAPVLAGETMKSLLMQARSVSSVMNNKLVGHHLEHYFFYVKLRDLADASDIVDMLMSTAASTVDLAAADNAYFYVKEDAPRWVEMCLNKIVTAYFRDEGDDAAHVGAITGLPLVHYANRQSIMESLIADADMPSDTVVAPTDLSDYQAEYDAWQFMTQTKMTEMSFEDYLGTFGVSMKTGEATNDPELIRYAKNWTYPTNTVDGEGNINTQASWSIQERADKDRFFKEPGFLVGVTVWRPKLYLKAQTQSAISLLNTAFAWMPATMKEAVHTSLRQFQANEAISPFAAAAAPVTGDGQLDSDLKYWVDVRDLFVYGEQFTNLTLDSSVSAVNPEDIVDFHGKKYPNSTALQALGTGDVITSSDGVVSLNILGTQLDVS